VAVLAACHTAPAPDAGPVPPVTEVPAPPPVDVPDAVSTYAGLYAQGFETMAFRPCDREASWWVAETGDLSARYHEVAARAYDPVYAVVKGTVGPEGHYGHMGAYTRELRVTEVVEVRRPSPGECGYAPEPGSPPP
jgi:hypothetical protein